MNRKTILEDRIDEVLARKVFPSATAWCVAAKLSRGYLGALKTRLKQGKVTQGKSQEMERLARAAGVSTEWLMGLTDGPVVAASGDVPTSGDPLFDDFLVATRLRPGLADALTKHPRRWRTSTVLLALSFESPSDSPESAVWWTGLLDGLERR
jgi:hypothetical protein